MTGGAAAGKKKAWQIGESSGHSAQAEIVTWALANENRNSSSGRSAVSKLLVSRSGSPKATKSEKVEIARKLRTMTPGAEVLIANWSLVEVDR